jgi:pimeloyl-ACP methyl ester carboxylesterase
MHFESFGHGREVYVGLHGWSGDHTTFAPLLPGLPAGARFFAADLPGHGLSPAPRAWELSEITAEIARSIAALDSPALTLVGSCSGGLLGLFAVRHLGAKVKRIILIDPFAFSPWYFNLFVSPRAGKVGRYAYLSTFANPVGRWVTNLSLKRHRTDATHLTESFSAVNHEVTYRYLKLLAQAGGAEQFGDLKLPIDVAYGEKTFGAVKESVRRWREVWPQARCWELKGAGHLPIEEATAQLSRIVFGQP